MTKRAVLCFALFTTLSFHGLAQHQTQNIRGIVTAYDTEEVLTGATVSIINTDFNTTSDDNGSFRIDSIPVGRYNVEIRYLGYDKILFREILLESGKELVLNASMTTSDTKLGAVVVRGNAVTNRSKVYPAHEILTIEETLRLPATFFDPARLAFSYAGVASTNDQANHMVVRGHSPNNNNWRLEGVEIVNPNHLSSGGTNTDTPARNGGGVNMLSAQMLGNSTFIRGAFPAAYGNALSSVMNMSLRKGNDQSYEFTGQIGIIGVDLSAEGPLSKKNKASFLTNYRYSTLGLLGAAGVDLGDEAINFQDFALTVAVPTKNKAELTLFGFAGNSENNFSSKDKEDIEFQKDAQNIVFDSRVVTGGIKYRITMGPKSKLGITSAYSKLESTRSSDIDTLESPILLSRARLSTTKLSSNVFFDYKINNGHLLTFGVTGTLLNDGSSYFTSTVPTTIIDGDIDGLLSQPYIVWNWQQGNFTMNAGGRYTHFSFNSTTAIEPSARLHYNLSSNQNIGLSYGLQSQRQLPDIYRVSRGFFGNRELELSKAHHLSLWYEKLWPQVRFKTEAYYQSLYDIPIAADDSNSFSTLNVFEEINSLNLVSDGKGTNYGLEISLQKYFSRNSFWMANVSLYESTYVGSDGIKRDTRFNGNYITNVIYGHEFPYSKKNKDCNVGINVRLTLGGGLRESPIDVGASQQARQTVFITEEAFSLQQSNLFKTDLRIYFKVSRKKFSSTVSLDIQNVTNQQNPSFRTYDTFQNQVLQQYQLGLIPILSYRVEF